MGNHAFLSPLFNYLRGEQDYQTKTRFGIHYMGFERHPDDPACYRADQPNKMGYQPRYLCFVSLVPEDKVDKNNAANRQRWAENIIKLESSPFIQAQYRYTNAPLLYKGDVTPVGDAPLPPLSDFLTLRDTMEVIRHAYRTAAGEKASVQDIVVDDDVLAKYYSQELIPQVHKLFDQFGSTTPATQGNAGSDTVPDELTGLDIPPFEL
jgi:hypothetical protein